MSIHLTHYKSDSEVDLEWPSNTLHTSYITPESLMANTPVTCCQSQSGCWQITHTQKKKLLQERVLAEKWWQVPEQSCYNTTGYVSSLRLTSWQDCHISGSTYFSMPSRQNRHKYLIYNFMNSLKTRSYLLLFLSLSGCYSLALLLCKVYYFPPKLKHNTLNHSCSY